MIFDKQANFDWNNAITVTRNSTDVVDLSQAGRDIAQADDLWLFANVSTTFTAGGSATLTGAFVQDDNAALSSPTTLFTFATTVAVASLVAGYQLAKQQIPLGLITEQYLGIVWTVATGPMTAGAVKAAFTPTVEGWKSFARGYVNY